MRAIEIRIAKREPSSALFFRINKKTEIFLEISSLFMERFYVNIPW